MRTYVRRMLLLTVVFAFALSLEPIALSPAYAASKGADPVAYWRFDEGGGTTAYDDSANNNDGTLTPGAGGTNTAVGQMWTRQGKNGGALECDGTDDYVSIGNVPGTLTEGTIEIWFNRRTSKSGYQMLFTDNGSQLEVCFSTDILQFYVDNSAITTANASNTGIWQHAAGTFSQTGNYRRLYLNGVLVASGAYTADATVAARYIGSRAGTYPFDGFIDDVKLYDYARTAAQIMVDYNAGAATYLGAGTDPNEGNPPVGYWKLDENTGTTVYDRSGSGRNGTFTNDCSWASGKFGSSVDFGGTNDYISVSDATGSVLDISSAITLEAWVNPDAYTDGGGGAGAFIVSKTAAYYLELGTDKKPRVYLYGLSSPGYHSSNSAIPLNTWSHIVATYDGSNIRMYINGVLDRTIAATGSITINDSALLIGSYTSTYSLDGKIDEVKIYNYARTPAQIAYDYNKGMPVAQYRFDEGGGAIAKNDYSAADSGAAPVGWWRMDNNWNDSSGSGFNGTANGTAAFSTTAKIGPYSGTFTSGDYTDCGNGAALRFPSTGKFTVEAWFRPTTVDGSWRAVVGKGASDGSEEICLLFNSANIYFDWGGGSGYVQNNGSLITANNWYHITAVYDASAAYSPNNTQGSVYLNGALISRDAGGNSPHIEDSSSNLRFGVARGATMPFIGQIDDVRIYNYARTAEQIYNDYKTTHGTLVNGATFADGKIGKAVSLDGTDDYVSATDIDHGSTFTLEAWIKAVAINGSIRTIISKRTDNNNWPAVELYVTAAGALYGYYSTPVYGQDLEGVYTDNGAITTGAWYHVAFTKSGDYTTMELYINGQLMPHTHYLYGSHVTSDVADSVQPVIIGRTLDGSSWINPFNGLIDDVRIYNYARTAGQIAQDCNAGTAVHFASVTGTADPWGGALPVAHWRMDENTGVLAKDASGNGNNGTLTNGPTWAQGKFGPCLSFGGTDDYVNCGASSTLDLRNAFTVSMWVYANTLHDAGLYDRTVIGSTNRQWLAHTRAGGTIAMRVVKSSTLYDAVPDVTYSAGSWFYLTAVYDGTAVKSYKNGQLVGSVNVSAPIDGTVSDTVLLGRLGSASGYWFNGKLDDVRVYNYARTPAQIAWDYNKGKPVGYWRFDEATSGSAVGTNNIKNEAGVYHGSGVGTNITYISGKFGGAIDFAGSEDYVNTGNWLSLIGGNDFTISMWHRADNMTGFRAMLGSYNDEIWLGYEPDGDLRWQYNISTGNTQIAWTPNYTTGQWVHVVGVKSSTAGSKLYVNGVEVASNSGHTSAGTYTAGNISIGKRISPGSAYQFDGAIDDVRIYNYARTAGQIMQDYNQGLAAKLSD